MFSRGDLQRERGGREMEMEKERAAAPAAHFGVRYRLLQDVAQLVCIAEGDGRTIQANDNIKVCQRREQTFGMFL